MSIIKDIYNFWSLRRDLLKVYEEEQLLVKFSQLYDIPFKVDRAARIYAVINPLAYNLKRNGSSQIFEYTVDGTNDYEYIKHWIFTKMAVVEKMFAAQNLLDVLVFDLKQIMVDDKPSGNYLITFTPYNFNDYVNSKKKLIILSLSLIVAAAIGTLLWLV